MLIGHSYGVSRCCYVIVRFFKILPIERGARRRHVVLTLCGFLFTLFDFPYTVV